MSKIIKTFFEVIGAYFITGLSYMSIFLASGGGAAMIEMGLSLSEGIFLSLYTAILWPMIIFWKSDGSPSFWPDYLVFIVFVVLIFLIFRNVFKDRRQNNSNDEPRLLGRR